MILDRQLQKIILLKLAETYPAPSGSSLLAYNDMDGSISSCIDGYSEIDIYRNLFYLQEHNLIIDFIVDFSDFAPIINFSDVRLTHKGMDFISDDGGLSAILGTVTVKFHEDTLKELLSTKILTSNLPPEEKGSLLNSIKNLSGKALEQIVTKLVDVGFEHSPQLFALLKTVLAS